MWGKEYNIFPCFCALNDLLCNSICILDFQQDTTISFLI